MASSASIAKHPIHPILVAFPIGLPLPAEDLVDLSQHKAGARLVQPWRHRPFLSRQSRQAKQDRLPIDVGA